MQRSRTASKLAALTLVSTLTLAAAESGAALAGTSDVISKMIERDGQRQAALNGYTAQRRYTLENTRLNKRAEMLVRMTVMADGTKEFDIVSESGSGAVRKRVFRKMLEAEIEASRPALRDRSRITPANYEFRLVGTDTIEGRPAYVLELTPRTENKYLIRGRIWVDTADYAIAHIEGSPARNPSLWTRSVHFTHRYSKSGAFWFAASNRSVTEVLIFGATNLNIEYFDYVPNLTAPAEPNAASAAK